MKIETIAVHAGHAVDAATGAVRDVFDETVSTQYESGWGRVNWRYLPTSNEIVWFSERDNWGHLYLYDLATGKLKNQITSGEWVVTQLLHVDEKNRLPAEGLGQIAAGDWTECAGADRWQRR